MPQDGEREFCDEQISCPDVDSIQTRDYGFVIQAGRDKTVPVLSANTSSSCACTSQPDNVARRSSSDMQVLFELLYPKVAARFLTEDVVTTNHSHSVWLVLSLKSFSLSIFEISTQLNERRKERVL